jgi:hypothetical protein
MHPKVMKTLNSIFEIERFFTYFEHFDSYKIFVKTKTKKQIKYEEKLLDN